MKESGRQAALFHMLRQRRSELLLARVGHRAAERPDRDSERAERDRGEDDREIEHFRDTSHANRSRAVRCNWSAGPRSATGGGGHRYGSRVANPRLRQPTYSAPAATSPDVASIRRSRRAPDP